MKQLRIISRNSSLALRQSELVKAEINKIYPDLKIKIRGVTTKGDKILTKSLDKIGGKGLFVKELQKRLLDGKADLAVHSLKDMPAKELADFIMVAVLKREDARDCFVSNRFSNLSQVPAGGVIGTSSSRRIALLKHHYPALEVKLLRGNIQTRLDRLDAHKYDGIILATAGLIRLGLEHRIKQYLSVEQFIPAIGQGAIVLEVLPSRLDLMLLLANLDDNDTYILTEAERMVGRILGVDCSVPVGVHATLTSHNTIKLSAIVATNADNPPIFTSVEGSKSNYLDLPLMIIDNLRTMGLCEMPNCNLARSDIKIANE
jgi:hydroxymethylbilane synthase